MGLFDLFKKSEPEKPPQPVAEEKEKLLALTEVTSGISLPQALANQWNEIEKTKLAYVAIEAVISEELTVRQSSFGYYPCLPKEHPYPTSSDGKFMFPLAQINFAELPVLPGFPQFGYLQFYISNNDLYGADFKNPQEQNGFRVLYFEEAEAEDCRSDFSFLEHAFDEGYLPFDKPHQLSFNLKEEYLGSQDVRSKPVLHNITQQYPSVSDELEDYVWEHFPSNGHKINGYAFFTQEDPRNAEQKDYVLLLQIDSDKDILWGDCGVANFFIHPDDLAKKDFSKVMYNWDCS